MQLKSTVTAPPSTTGESPSFRKKNQDRFSGKAFHAVLRYSRTRGKHRLFLTTLAGKWASDAGLAWPAHSSIAEAMNCSVRLVGDLQRELVEMGELEITGTSKLGTNILHLVSVRDGENFRPKKVSQKAEPQPRRKKCTPPVQVRQTRAAKSADKEPEISHSPNTIPLPSVSEKPVPVPEDFSNRKSSPLEESKRERAATRVTPDVRRRVMVGIAMQARKADGGQDVAKYTELVGLTARELVFVYHGHLGESSKREVERILFNAAEKSGHRRDDRRAVRLIVQRRPAPGEPR